jgi:hypothetical protein
MTSSPFNRNLLIAGVIAVIAVAAAFVLGVSVMKGGAASGVQLAANDTKPGPGQTQQAPAISRMKLEAQYAGPLRDTLVQRWRDPIDGTICYIYLPILVQHGPGPNGLVQYGANGIGSISCLHGQ